MNYEWVRRELGHRRGWILVVVAVSWFFAVGVRLSVPILLPYLSAEFDLTLAVSGSLVTLLFGGYAVGQLPGGVLGDRFGERSVLAGGIALLMAGILVIATLETFRALLVGVFLMSFGSGIFAPTRFTILSDIYPGRDGTAHGIVMAAGEIGNTVLPVVAGFLAASLYWRFGLGYALPFLLVLVAALWTIVPERTSEAARGDPASISLLYALGRELRRGPVLVAVYLLLVQSIIFQGHTGLYPTYLVVEKGLSKDTVPVVMGIFFGSAVVVHLVAGASADRFGSRPVIATLLGTGIVAFGALPFVAEIPEIVIVTVFTSAPLGVVTVAMPYLIELLSDEMQGTGFGTIRTLYISLAAIAPFVIGSLGDLGHFDLGFLLLGIVAASALVASRFLPEPR